MAWTSMGGGVSKKELEDVKEELSGIWEKLIAYGDLKGEMEDANAKMEDANSKWEAARKEFKNDKKPIEAKLQELLEKDFEHTKAIRDLQLEQEGLAAAARLLMDKFDELDAEKNSALKKFVNCVDNAQRVVFFKAIYDQWPWLASLILSTAQVFE